MTNSDEKKPMIDVPDGDGESPGVENEEPKGDDIPTEASGRENPREESEQEKPLPAVERQAEENEVPDDADPGKDSAESPGEALEENPESSTISDEYVGVRFRQAGNMEYFRTGGLALSIGSKVVVEAERGLALGTVVTCAPPKKRPRTGKNGGPPLPRVVRIADKRDELIRQENEEKNRTAFKICQERIRELGLDMSLKEVEYQHSGNKSVFYFSAEGRIDFRELVRMLAKELRIRVEMRQIGIRDEAKLLGGLGPCGRPVCCATFLDGFTPVSIRMAKEQNLTLNPEKVSGLCSRLMCCLGYEAETYKAVQKGLPKIGKKVDTWRGRGRVLEINIFTGTMRLELEGREYIAITLDDFRAYKEDPEGFTKIIQEREEKERQDKRRAVLNGDLDIGGSSKRRDRSTSRKNGTAAGGNGKGRKEPEASARKEENASDASSGNEGEPPKTGRRSSRRGRRRSPEKSGERAGQENAGNGGRESKPSERRRPPRPRRSGAAKDGASPDAAREKSRSESGEGKPDGGEEKKKSRSRRSRGRRRRSGARKPNDGANSSGTGKPGGGSPGGGGSSGGNKE